MIKTVPFDAAEFLTTERAQRELIADALESGHAPYIANAIGIVARARGMSKVAEQAGVTRAALYRASSQDGDPQLSTLLGALKALDMSLTIKKSKKKAA